jgi:multidrug resistance efflux pump
MKKFPLILLITASLLLSACGSASTPTPIPTLVLGGGNSGGETPQPAARTGDVVASAVLVPAQEAHLAFATAGMVAKVHARVGERVTAGDVLVELDDTAARLEVERAQRALRELTSPAAVAAAEQAVANAQQIYDEAKKKADSLNRRFADTVTLDYLEAQVTLAQQALDQAREVYNRTRGLSSADPARAKAATNLYNAQRAYNTALANLAWFTEKPSENEIARTLADLNAAASTLQEAKWYLAELKGESLPAEASGAKLTQLQQARADLQTAQMRLAQTRLVAPISGVVTQVNVVAGEYALAGQALVVLSDVEHLQVKTTDLSERDVVRVKAGARAVIRIKALNQEFGGVVLLISPLANTLGGDVVYEVTLTFDEQPAGALAGMSADVVFTNE